MIVGLHGKKGHGKDATLERMKLITPDMFAHHSFAAKMKASACALLNIDLDTMERLKRENRPCITVWDGEDVLEEITMRVFLQRYGTESHRDIFGQSFWVDLAMAPALRDERDGLVPVFTDCRFPNEAEAVLSDGGVVFHIVGIDEEGDDDHPSEVVLPPRLITATIDNTVRDDGFASLDAQLHCAIEEHGVLA
jgi:hypothetical protein